MKHDSLERTLADSILMLMSLLLARSHENNFQFILNRFRVSVRQPIVVTGHTYLTTIMSLSFFVRFCHTNSKTRCIALPCACLLPIEAG